MMFKMMRCYIGLINVLMFLGFVSCSDEIPEPLVADLKVNTQLIEFDSTGGDQVLIIASNTNWIIEHDAVWCWPSIDADSGDVSLTVKAEPNDSAFERSTIFRLSADELDEIEINITQQGIEADTTTKETGFTDMRKITSLELSKLMGLGWNLGNSLEALSTDNGVLSGDETSWGNPRVSERLIDSVKAAGFNAVRIPVSWSHKLVNENTFTIDMAWLERVEEVVNYVLDNQMYAIINIHWDGGWMNHPVNAKKDEINYKLETIWTQVAEYFIDYNDYLLFAGSNEVHVEDNWGAPTTENAEVQNSFNQTFVNAVRATGERNSIRHLIVQGYNTNIDHTVSRFKAPEDPTTDRLMLEVHFYDPYDFTLQESGGKTQWGSPFSGGDVPSWGQEAWVEEAFGKMNSNFVKKGIPVILGEYGAILRSSLSSGLEEHIAARNYYLEYTTRVAVENGIVPFYWDNGYTGNNSFGLFNRSTGAQVHTDAIQAIVNAVKKD